MAAQQNEGEFSRQDYLTPGKPIAFGGRSLVYRYARPSFKNMTQVASKLSEIDTYTRHRASKRPKFNPYFLYSPRELLQCDLCDKSDLKEANDDISYWLCVIDCFTRKVWLKPLKRKSDAYVIPAMKSILDEISKKSRIRTLESGIQFNRQLNLNPLLPPA